MDIEILAHVRAPARAVDDRRYLAIAEGILDFQPTCTTAVHSRDSSDACDDLSDAMNSTQLRSSAVAESIRSRIQSAQPSTRRTGKVRDRFSVSKSRISTRTMAVQKKVDNPPYRSPLRKKSISTRNICATPSSEKLVATASGLQSVLVPNTIQHMRKRPSSTSHTPCPRMATVLNSQPAASIDLENQSWSTWSQSTPQPVVMTSIDEHKKADSLIAAAKLQEPFDSTKSPGYVPALENSGVDNEQERQMQGQSSVVADSEYHAHSGSQVAMLAKSALFGMRSSTTQDQILLENDTSTATPTQHNSDILQRSEVNKISPTAPVAQSPIDLVTPEPSAFVPPQKKYTETETVNVHDTVTHDNSTVTATDSTLSFASMFLKLKALPLVIDSPSPNTGQLFLPASKQPILKATAEALGMPERFMPATMTRAVKGTERGYWKIPFHVVGSTHEQVIRRAPPERQWKPKLDDYSPLLKHATLTEDEFITVWADLTQFIGSGNAGYNVKVIRRSLSIRSDGGLDDATARFVLQIYCNGEAIPYVYALLLVCSRMHILCKPIQWISAVDEGSVLTMTGNEFRKGDQGSWSCFKNAEGKEFWHARNVLP